MNLADMLSYTDIHQLGKIALNYDCECNGHSKNELIQSILATINRWDILDKYIQNMSTEDMRFLNSLLFDKREFFSLEEMIARVQQTKFIKESHESWNPREVISQFKLRGWLFNGYSQQTKYLFQVPMDLKRRFSEVLTSRFLSLLHKMDEPEAYRDEQKVASEDINHFLRYLHQYDVLLTTEGYMYKRHVQQILESFTVREEPVGKSGWRFGYGRRYKEYPNRLSFLYDYCYYSGLIEENDDKLSLSELGVSKLLSGKREDGLQIYKLWLRLYKGPIHNLQSIVHWVDRLCRNWVTLESLMPVLCNFIKPYYYDSPEVILEHRIIQMMLHLGLVRIGRDEQYGTVVMVTKIGSSIISGTYISDEETIIIKD